MTYTKHLIFVPINDQTSCFSFFFLVLFCLFPPPLTNVLQLTHPISILSVVIQHILICVFNLTKSKVNPVFTLLPDKKPQNKK